MREDGLDTVVREEVAQPRFRRNGRNHGGAKFAVATTPPSELNGRITAVAAQPATGRTVTVVIPALNEGRNIGAVLAAVPDHVDEIIVVDGGSTDDTVAASLAARPEVRVIGQKVRGKGAALRAGFEAATSDVIVSLDADCSMDPAEIDHFLARLDEGYDLVKGSRFLDGGGTDDMEALRRWGNAALRSVANGLYRADFTDLTYGYLAFRRELLDHIELRADGFDIEVEMIVRAMRASLRVGEVACFEARRAHGHSNLNTWRDGSRILRTLVRYRMSRLAPVIPRLPLETAESSAQA